MKSRSGVRLAGVSEAASLANGGLLPTVCDNARVRQTRRVEGCDRAFYNWCLDKASYEDHTKQRVNGRGPSEESARAAGRGSVLSYRIFQPC